MIKLMGYNYTNNGFYEKYYEEKAAEGYFIKKMYLRFIHVFERDNPKKIKYKFEYHNSNSLLDDYEKKEREDFIEQSKQYGWKHIYKTINYHLFYSDNLNDIKHLSFDNEIEKKGIKRNFKWSLLNLILYLPLIITLILKQINNDFSVETYPFQKQQLIFEQFRILLYISFIFMTFDEVYFYFRNKKNFEIYENDLIYNKPIFSTVHNLSFIVLLIYFVFWFLFIK